MGTNLINAIQHRNGPNQRPPNSIFGNGGTNQQLLSNHLICGFLGAVSCGVALITYINYSLKHEGPSYEIEILAILSIAVFIIILSCACTLLIRQRRNKRPVIIYIEPFCPEIETNNSIFADTPTVETPPSYENALNMPSTDQKHTSQDLPPSYDNIKSVAV